MNTVGRNTDKKHDNQTIFTKETFGVVLILFSTLSLVCLITRESVFSAIGVYVNEFLLGLFGYFAYAFTVMTWAFGFYLVTDKRFTVKPKIKLSVFAVLLCVGVIWQVAKFPKGQLSFGEYLRQSYVLAEGGISSCTPGGIITALFAFPISAILSDIGTYVVLSAVSVLCVYYVAKTVKDDNTQVRPGDTEVHSSYVEQSAGVKDVEIEGEKEYPVDFDGGMEQKPANQKLFVNNPSGFAFKTKKELERDEGNGLKIEFSENGLGIINYSGSYSRQYSEDLKRKIAYVKTPAVIDVNDTINRSDGKNTGYIPRKNTPIEILKQNAEKEEQNQSEEIAPPSFSDERYVSPNPFATSNIFGIKENEDTDVKESGDGDDAVKNATEYEQYAQAYETEGGVASVYEEEQPQEDFKQQLEDAEKEESTGDEFAPIEQSNVINEETDEIFGKSQEKAESKEAYAAKDAYTSRVNADGNYSVFKSQPINNEYTAAENVEEEKPKKEIPPINREYFRPPLSLLEDYKPPLNSAGENHEERMRIIKQVFHDFGVEIETRGYVQGPSITRYEIKMPAGFSVKKTQNYDDDLKTYLRTRYGVIIEAPIPGKDLVGIEVANESKVTVGLKSLLEAQAGVEYKPSSLMFAIGKDIVGNPIFDNLAKGPHYLVAGSTGSGKSVCLNIMIVSLIMRYSPEELRLILIDPKGVEFSIYEHIPHLMVDEIITEPKKALGAFQWAINEMERRYKVLKECGSVIRDIESYNKEIASDTVAKMPRIVIVVDELSNLMETCKREMEAKILSIAQKARSVGIHLVLATQRPSVDIITGVIKANLPSRIALKVMNFADSNTIISAGGAEKLLGNGDMLFQNSSMSDFERYQGAFISGKEVGNIVNYIIENNKAYFDDDLKEFLEQTVNPPQEEDEETQESGGSSVDIDGFFLKCLWLGVNSGSISISMLQRRFQIGYSRAGGIVDKMERLGFVSANEGAKARRILITREEFLEKFGPVAE